MVNMESIKQLNYLVKTYDDVTKMVARTLQRMQAITNSEEVNCDTLLSGQGKQGGMVSVKGWYSRAIEKELGQWELWERWLKEVPGIGPAIAGRLILLYYYRFVPVCQECGEDLEKVEGGFECVDCGKAAKGGGLLKNRVEERDFPTISKWWAYMGRHTVEGVMPKRKTGVVSNWSTVGRTVGFHIGEQFNRQAERNPYKAFMLERKKKHAKAHPDWTKGHVHNAAKNEAVKLFLSHMWTVAREIEGKPISEPYAGVIMGHTNIVKPFYWQSDNRSETQGSSVSDISTDVQNNTASDVTVETQSHNASRRTLKSQTGDASQCSNGTQGRAANRYKRKPRMLSAEL